MEDSKITIIPRIDGPYVIQGPIQIVDVEGNEFEVKGDTVYLCRCGDSGNKPFCDGTHRTNGFSAATRAA